MNLNIGKKNSWEYIITMGGGLMQLVAYGAQDIYLTGNPQITFFKVVYRRHTNFSMETIQQTIQGSSSLSDTSETSGTVTISRNGDLLSEVYVSTPDTMTHGDKLVKSVDLEIGGQLIDRQTQEWMQIWNELTTPGAKQDGLAYMMKARGVSHVGSAMIPLRFWFCRNPGLALPLIALQYHEVKLKFTFNQGQAVGMSSSLDVTVWADYIYLDTDERRRFAQVSHEYLIEQVQMMEGNSGTATSVKLNFNHPVKEIIWTSHFGTNLYSKARIELNGHDRFAEQEEEYFQLRQPYKYHTAIPHQNRTVGHSSAFQVTNFSAEAEQFAQSAITSGKVMVCEVDTDGFSDGGDNGGFGDTTLKATSAGAITASDIVYAFNPDDVRGVADFHKNQTLTFEVTGLGSLANGTGQRFITTTVTECSDDRNIEFGEISIDDTGPAVFIRLEDSLLEGILGAEIRSAADFSILSIVAGSAATASTSSMHDKINVYSFALKPEEHQPSGTCNFSRIDSAKLILDTANGTSFNVYAHNYNVLRIMSGMGGLAYSN